MLAFAARAEIQPVIFDNTNLGADVGRVTDCLATPELPAGLKLAAQLEPLPDAVAVPGEPTPSGNGCILTGTPSTPTLMDAATVYTVMVMNSNTLALTTPVSLMLLDITIQQAAPDIAEPDAQVYVTGAPVMLELVGQRWHT